MKIITRTIIKDITHDDLVSLLSTGLYGSTWLYATYDVDKFKDVIKDCDTLEDALSCILLNGGYIWLVDTYAEDEDEANGNVCECVYDEKNGMKYKVTLERIKVALRRAANGTFHANNEHEKKYMHKCVERLIDNEGDFDYYDADNILQIVMFNEMIYG